MTIMWNMIIKGWKVINMSGLVVGLFDTYEEAQKFVEKIKKQLTTEPGYGIIIIERERGTPTLNKRSGLPE